MKKWRRGRDSDTTESGDVTTDVSSQLLSFFFSLGAGLAGDKPMSPKIMNCPHCGKILPVAFWHEESQADKRVVKCPQCGSTRNRKEAKRYTASGVIQRYYCVDCGRRFSK